MDFSSILLTNVCFRSFVILLIFNGKLNIKTDNSGCMFIQDANTNGCPDSDPNCGDNNEIAQKYFD